MDDCFRHYCRLSCSVFTSERQIVSEKYSDHLGIASILDQLSGANVRVACFARAKRSDQ